MRANLIKLAVGITFTGLGLAHPSKNLYDASLDAGFYNSLTKRTVSPDNTCGNVFSGANNSYTCDATVNTGGCCSQFGFCGNTTDYCDTGCQDAFGICQPTTVQPPSSFTCGLANSDASCISGLCCSGAGFCGNTTDYCLESLGCQSGFGLCTLDAPPPSAGGNCGPNFGNAVCANNQCCSMAGYCGTTEDFCADPGNCFLGFGRCDSDATPAGNSTLGVPRPLLGPVTYTDDILDCVQNNVVALSYDDGPYIYTAQLLDLLKTYGFTATFFITGNNNGKGEIDTTAPYPDLIKRMVAEGHQVASHTWSHYSLSNSSHDLRVSQMVKNEMAFNNIIGMWPTYMRPPYSDCTEASGCWDDLLALGYHRVYFDLDTQDYLNPLPTQIQNSKDIVQQALAAPGVTDYLSIQHDIVQQSVANLSSFYFDQILAKGWTGVTVGECLGDDKANWYRSFPASSSTSSTLAITSVPVTTPSSLIPKTTTTSSSIIITNPVSSSTSQSSVLTTKPSSSLTILSPLPPTTSLPTKPPTTTSLTTKVLTTSSSSTKPPTTTPPSSTVKPTTSSQKPTTTSVAPPAPTCEFKNGKWCGSIATFSSKTTCAKAVTSCYGDSIDCLFAGFGGLLSCTQMGAVCGKLSAYCVKCSNAAGSCGNAGFGY